MIDNTNGNGVITMHLPGIHPQCAHQLLCNQTYIHRTDNIILFKPPGEIFANFTTW